MIVSVLKFRGIFNREVIPIIIYIREARKERRAQKIEDGWLGIAGKMPKFSWVRKNIPVKMVRVVRGS